MPAGVNSFISIDMKPTDPSLRRRAGRPLSFDREVALKKAMLLFWRQGYEGTSISDLTTALGVTPPSIYAAFGDKKRLFLEAVQAYLAGPLTSFQIIDGAPTAEEAARGLLEAAAKGFTGADTPPGCLLASSAISGSAASDDIKNELAAMRGAIEERLMHRLEADVAAGGLDANVDPDALAGYVMAVIQGLSTLARDGANRDKLERVARAAMAGWPRRRG